METQAQEVVNKYGKALLLFSKCHNAFNSSNHFQDSDVSTLRKLEKTLKLMCMHILSFNF